jgi:hypothetical protein
MIKKGLFFGTIALALLVLFAGCSNPTSETKYVDRITSGEFDYPEGTVFTDEWNELLGLLNNFEDLTNQVSHISYGGELVAELKIPTGKTVYWRNNLSGTGNIIVEPEARLIFLGNAETSSSSSRLLLVNGVVEVYGTLKVDSAGSDPAMQVADYYEEGAAIKARDTVIGTGRVVIHSGGVLNLAAADISKDPGQANRFTPAQAWAAAGEGSLTIGEDSNTYRLSTSYSVKDVLAGVYPSKDREYWVYTEGGGVLPSLIPTGAAIYAEGAITDADDHTLTVNGGLIVDNATLADIEKLTISSADTDKLASRAVVPVPGRPDAEWIRSYLKADNATLAKAESIIIGDNGEFESASEFALPEGAKISLGRSARFLATGTQGTYEEVISLFVGPAAVVQIDSSELTFAKLASLTIQDGGNLTAKEGQIAVDLTPVLGRKITYNVQLAAGKTQTITGDVELTSGTITANTDNPIIVDTGATLTLGTGVGLDFSTTTVETSEVAQIKGTIVAGPGAAIKLPNTQAAGFAVAGDTSKIIALGDTGKIVLQEGASLIGTFSNGSPLSYITNTNIGFCKMQAGSEIELSNHKITITKGEVKLINNHAGAVNYPVIAGDTLEILDGAKVTIAEGKGLALGAAAAGAKITGSGKLVAGKTEIIGGPNGWEAKASATGAVIIAAGASNNATTITADAAATSLVAGDGAAIIQSGGVVNSLTIKATGATNGNTEGVINLATGGSITLKADVYDAGGSSQPAKITLPQYNIIKIAGGETTGAVDLNALKTALGGSTTPRDSIGIGADLTGKAAAATANSTLTQIIGGATNTSITGPTAVNPSSDIKDLVIKAGIAATGT